MPPRNNPLPNAVNVFHCDICEKGYPRQLDYENHLNSYDHTHRTRLADMKKITAAKETDSNRPSRGPVLDMRAISIADANKRPGLGKGFTKIAGGTAPGTGGSRFKKVGKVTAGTGKSSEAKTVVEVTEVGVKSSDKREAVSKDVEMDFAPQVDAAPSSVTTQQPVTDKEPETQEESKPDEDVVMAEAEDVEIITWKEYDFTRPTGCDHANCPGCKITATYDSDGWVVLPRTVEAPVQSVE